jgi:prophage regulatory protein
MPKQFSSIVDLLQDVAQVGATNSQQKQVVAQLRIALLLRSEVQERIKISRAALYAKLNPVDPAYDPTFPIPIRIGARAVRWIESEVDAYIASLPRARSVIGGAQ